MEMVFYYNYLLFSLVVSFSIPVFLFFRKHRSYSNLPPGRMGWPVIGESLAFMSAIRAGRPEKFFFDRGGAEDGAAFKTCLTGEPTVVLCGATGNKFICSNEDTLVTACFSRTFTRLFFPSLTNADAEIKKFRTILPGLLRVEALRRSIGVMDDVARRYFATEWNGGMNSASVARLAKRYTFRVAMGLLANLDDREAIERLEGLFETVESGIIAIPVNFPGTKLNRALKAVKLVREEVVMMVRRRKAELAEGTAGAGQDILSQILVTLGDCSELEIANWIMMLLLASHGNISNTCTSVFKFLTDLPRVYEAVSNEQMTIAKSKAEGEALNWDDIQSMKYSWNVAQEVLRLTSPVPGSMRDAMVDFTYNGFLVPKGWKIFWGASTTHMNPAFFPDPDRFDPNRFEGTGPAPKTFVPFGSGPRMCIGKEYARVKILVFMHNLVKHCPLT